MKNAKLGWSATIMFVFGGMFVGIGANPAKDAPHGTPGLVYSGLILLFVAFLMTTLAILSNKLKVLESDKIKGKLTAVVLAVAVILVGVGMYITFASSPGGGGYSKNVCQSCGRSWEPGDSRGNYRSISETNMCKNCYNNYQWAQDQLGK